MQVDNAFIAQPKGLSKKGRQAYRAIVDALRKHGLVYTGGGRAFYSPKEWKDRGEDYGTESQLVVVYDGGDLFYVFNSSMHSEFEKPANVREEIDKRLADFGLYVEECTGWYAAVYEI
jgi:hypothetical protein